MDVTLAKILRFSEDQYSNENRLNARVQIYDLCEKKTNFHQWVFDKLDFNNVIRILELGCGNGLLWRNNIHRIPANVNIVLSDISNGMVDAAREALKKHNSQFDFSVTDACQTPFENNNFQMIIANHMLPLIENKERLFSEIDRLLTDTGYAYASTASTTNFHELSNITNEFDKSMAFDIALAIQSFNLENGESVLANNFNIVNSYIYQNDVIVKNSEPLILYLASCYSPKQLDILVKNFVNFRSNLESIIKKAGEIRITNKNVLYKFQKNKRRR